MTAREPPRVSFSLLISWVATTCRSVNDLRKFGIHFQPEMNRKSRDDLICALMQSARDLLEMIFWKLRSMNQTFREIILRNNVQRNIWVNQGWKHSFHSFSIYCFISFRSQMQATVSLTWLSGSVCIKSLFTLKLPVIFFYCNFTSVSFFFYGIVRINIYK